jgi:hypothetical protein
MGVIQLPLNPDFLDREAEIIIIPKRPSKKYDNLKRSFVSKWGGALADVNPDMERLEYLDNKYK